MVVLHTWLPDPAALASGATPDLGHSSLQVGAVYVSFWPEQSSLVGQIVSLLKGRHARQPESYAEEIEPKNGFMQRAAAFSDPLPGVNETVAIERWRELQDTHFDANSYNCSHLTRDVLDAALPPALRGQLSTLCEKKEHVPAVTCTPASLRAAILELLPQAGEAVNASKSG